MKDKILTRKGVLGGEVRGAAGPRPTSLFTCGGRNSISVQGQGRRGALSGRWQVAGALQLPCPPHSRSSCSPSSASALASALSTLRLLASPALGTLLGRVGTRGVCQKALRRLRNHEKRPGVWNLTVLTCFWALAPGVAPVGPGAAKGAAKAEASALWTALASAPADAASAPWTTGASALRSPTASAL